MSHVCFGKIIANKIALRLECGTEVELENLRIAIESVGREHEEITISADETITHKCWENIDG